MKALLKLTGLVVLMVAVGTLAACAKEVPPVVEPPPPPPVEEPPPPPPPPPPPAREFEEAEPVVDVLTIGQINEEGILQTIYFDYDESEVRADQRAKLQANAQFLRDNDHFRLVVAGHCDERGTREYNMALGERRASATMQYLVSLGVPASRIDIISYGEENPAATESNEAAWAQNRRAQFQAIDSNDR